MILRTKKIRYLSEYNRLVKGIVAKSFPELAGRRIIVIEKEAKYRAKANYTLRGLQITMTYKLRKLPLKVRKRILTHELSHMVDFVKDGWLKSKIGFYIYLMSRNVQYSCERRTNIREIQRGYGNYILEVCLENKKRGLEYSLTEKEIKEYIQKYKGKQS